MTGVRPMTNDATATNIWLSSAQQQCLSALLDTILPASEDGTMPSAKELNFLTYLAEQDEDFMPSLGLVLNQFDEEFKRLEKEYEEELKGKSELEYAISRIKTVKEDYEQKIGLKEK